jgi:PAS domain S-box-containing protein
VSPDGKSDDNRESGLYPVLGLREFMDTLPFSVLLVDEDHIILEANRTVKDVFDLEPEKIVGGYCPKVIHDSDEPDTRCPLEEAAREHKAIEREFYEPRQDKWILSGVYPTGLKNDENKKIFIHTAIDITDRRMAEEALRHSESNYREIFNAANDAIFIVDIMTGKIIDMNNGALEMFRYSREEFQDLRFETLGRNDFHDEEAESLKSIRRESNREPWHFEWLATDKNGREFWTEVSLKPAQIGSQRRLLAVVRDITYRKELENQLLQSQKMEALGRLAGGVAHDFNNLLTAIVGYSDILMSKFQPNDPNHEMVKTIRDTGERAALLTHRLLAFSRKEDQKKVSLNLNDLIMDMSRMLPALLGESIESRNSLDPSLKTVQADPGLMEQVLLNLVVNAREAMPKGGRLTITSGNEFIDESKYVFYPDAVPGNHVMISISDTGVGMTREVRDRLFEPFFTTKEKGTGLGLSTVYGIVKQLGGHISVYSEVGKGSSFKLLLPAFHDQPGEDGTGSQAAGELIPRGAETIMVVEDDETVLEFTVGILDKLGYSVLRASSKKDALKMYEEHEGDLDILLTDVVLPDSSGPELVQELTDRHKDLKVVFMSGYADDRLNDEVLASYSAGFLPKPFTQISLATKIRKVLDES